MGGLNEKDRAAIVLRFFEKKSLSEVGDAFGTTEDAAKTRVNRAVDRLRKFFRKRGITLSATVLAGAVSANSVQAAPIGLVTTVTAAVQGAALALPTVALVKGTLNLMAWTKVKTAVVIGAGVILAGGTIGTLALGEMGSVQSLPRRRSNFEREGECRSGILAQSHQRFCRSRTSSSASANTSHEVSQRVL
jgi:hypothetical protein